MQKYLESLTALHSADLQAQGSRELGRTVRRAPVTTEHPLVRTNPVTGWKSLFFNPGFVTKIVGVPKTESDAVIRLLNEIVATSPEIHARFQWGKGDVAFWDNRVTVCTVAVGRSSHGANRTCRTTLHRTVLHHTDVMLCESAPGLSDRISTRKAVPKRRIWPSGMAFRRRTRMELVS
jgi:sulfonate dioxygenase